MYLERIVETKRREVARLKERTTAAALEREIAGLPACRGFARALADGRRRSIGLIAEVKKASPSKGLIRPDFDPVAIARAYAEAGADCLSVLTDKDYFQGDNAYLTAVREAVGLPVLRKDFIIDPIQMLEARCIGADAVLLIAAILTADELQAFHRLARDLGMDALIEVHDERELEAALSLEPVPALIGINNRNLHTFVTDLAVTERLIRLIPPGVTVVSESGIAGADDLAYLKRIGAHAVLIGEYFMRRDDVGRAVVELMAAAEGGVRE
jgi:indole-3-glycerol phosphate synthase